MAIRPVLIDKRSPFVGESCALCQEPFAPGEEIVICPEDATRHHVHCWGANQNRCAAYGCNGRGSLITRTALADEERDGVDDDIADEPASKVRTLPTSSFSCAQSCLVLAIAVSIVIFAISCFGLWAILDFIVVEVFGWQYRQPLTELLVHLPTTVSLTDLREILAL